VLADALLEKLGGDSMSEVHRNLDGYLTQLVQRNAALGRAEERAEDE
jgi:hypothetical protein